MADCLHLDVIPLFLHSPGNETFHAGFMGALLLAITSMPVQAASEIVIAIRYLQAHGTSHAQLFLYSEDGRLIRQLADDNSCQMMDPLFAPDGETIVFTKATGTGKEYWSIKPRGGNLHKLASAPVWYRESKISPFFTDQDPVPPAGASPSPVTPAPTPSSSKALVPEGPDRYTTPDGTQEIILKVSEDDNDDTYDGVGHGKYYQLHDLKTGESVEMGKLPGFLGLFDVLHLSSDKENHFLLSPPLRVAFFALHIGSTDGDTTFALDLTGKRLVQLSPNWVAPIPLPGEPAFLALASVRYVPIPGSPKTANSTYLERWDANLVKVRYARENTAAICYGASMYRPRMPPAVITIPGEER
ncbi:MAG: hypothetical protein WCD79_08825 [Chthoniobacteraceae bacterium]